MTDTITGGIDHWPLRSEKGTPKFLLKLQLFMEQELQKLRISGYESEKCIADDSRSQSVEARLQVFRDLFGKRTPISSVLSNRNRKHSEELSTLSAYFVSHQAGIRRCD